MNEQTREKLRQYRNQFIIIRSYKHFKTEGIILHGEDSTELFAKVKEMGIECPVIMFVNDDCTIVQIQ